MKFLSRRRFLTFAALPLALGAELAIPKPLRTIFLPPRAGWVAPYGRIIVPASELPYYSAELASRVMTYDSATEMMSLWDLGKVQSNATVDWEPQCVDDSPVVRSQYNQETGRYEKVVVPNVQLVVYDQKARQVKIDKFHRIKALHDERRELRSKKLQALEMIQDREKRVQMWDMVMDEFDRVYLEPLPT